MRRRNSKLNRAVEIGLAAGLFGTGVMVALRSFDQRYARATIPETAQDPGEFMLESAEGITKQLPGGVRKPATLFMRVVYGSLFGAIYGLWRARELKRSSLADGTVLGTAVYAAGYFGWLPALGLTRPVWKQRLPEVAGELSRHVAYGVATAAAYDAIDNAV